MTGLTVPSKKERTNSNSKDEEGDFYLGDSLSKRTGSNKSKMSKNSARSARSNNSKRSHVSLESVNKEMKSYIHQKYVDNSQIRSKKIKTVGFEHLTKEEQLIAKKKIREDKIKALKEAKEGKKKEYDIAKICADPYIEGLQKQSEIAT